MVFIVLLCHEDVEQQNELKLQQLLSRPKHHQLLFVCICYMTKSQQQHVSWNPNNSLKLEKEIVKNERTKWIFLSNWIDILTFPQKEHVYFECCVISIFFTILRSDAPYRVPYFPTIPTFLVRLAWK